MSCCFYSLHQYMDIFVVMRGCPKNDCLLFERRIMKIKRIYLEADPDDGYRILTDRLWPRGISKDKAKLDEWNKEIAPSAELRIWFAHKADRFQEFALRYRSELQEKLEELERIRLIAKKGELTLLYGAKDSEHNQAVVLLEVLQEQTTLPPIKRSELLKPLSRNHHFGLLLSWKIRQGLQKNVDSARIEKYVNWIWSNQLQAHFELEEKNLFPLLGADNTLSQKAIELHNDLRQLFGANPKTNEVLDVIQKKLDELIRFEEREVFNEAQTLIEVKNAENLRPPIFHDDWNDEFWI